MTEVEEKMAGDLYTEVRRTMERANGKERVRLRELLRLPPEPCRLWCMDGYIYCSTHSEGWQYSTRPKPDLPCVADLTAEEIIACAPITGGTTE